MQTLEAFGESKENEENINHKTVIETVCPTQSLESQALSTAYQNQGSQSSVPSYPSTCISKD